MTTFDRSKFQASKTSDMKRQEQEIEKAVSGKGGRANFLKLQHGKNKIRILPAHPGQSSFCFPRTTHYMDVLVKYKKDGVDVEEIKPKPVFNAKVHGGLADDPIDAYIDTAYKVAYDTIDGEDARKKFLAPMLNFRTGIKGKTRWVCYAMMVKGDSVEVGRLDLPVTVKEKLNELAIGEDTDDGVIETDPFTDPDNGRCIFVTYNKDADKPGDYYKASIDLRSAYPIDDTELEWLMDQPRLDEMLVNSYTSKDFDMAIDGLKRFDEEHNFNIFEDERFLSRVERIAPQVPQFVPKDSAATEAPKKAPKKAPEKAVTVTLEEMGMDDLKDVIKGEGLGIRVLARYTEEDVREFIKEERAIRVQELEAPAIKAPDAMDAGTKKDALSDLENELSGGDGLPF